MPKLPIKSLSLAAAALSSWIAFEGFSPGPIIPTKGDVPTIGHGSTRYEDGTRVTMDDPEITRERAAQLAVALLSEDERCLKRSLPEDFLISKDEFELYADFIGQYGCGTWRASTPRRLLAAEDYVGACNALLLYRFAGGRNCSLPENWGPRGCKGVWDRQQKRNARCLSAQF